MWVVVMTAALLFLTALSSESVVISLAASPATYDNVQISLQTSQSGSNVITLTVYNASDSVISSSQGQYPEFSFELPSGSYLFVATAVNRSSDYWWSASTTEYGFLQQQISGDTHLTIQTQTIESVSMTKVSIQARFANGSAASAVSVYASIAGLWYWWQTTPATYRENTLVMWNQTGSDGYATLTIPKVPVEITAWTWLSIDLPTNQTTVQKNIGGENINVTVYWQPTYVGLSGSAIVTPTQNSAAITLHAFQQPGYWTYALGVQYATGATVQGGYPGITTYANMPTGLPSSMGAYYQQSRIGGGTPTAGSPDIFGYTGLPPQLFPAITTTSQTGSGTNQGTGDYFLAAIAVAAIALSVIAIMTAVVRARK